MTPAQRLINIRRHQHAVERHQYFQVLAFHESGHAAAGRYFNIEIGGLRVGLDSGGGEAGQTFVNTDAFAALRPFSCLFLLLAGGAAARRVSDGRMAADDDDMARSLAIVSAAFPDVRDAARELALARQAAEHFVDQNWGAISALARALLDAGGQLSGDEAAPYLVDIPTAKPPRPAPARSTRPAERTPDLRHRMFGSRVVESTGPGGAVYRTVY